MPQYRLEHYFTPSQAPWIPSGRSFLHLPYSVRKLIYEYAGLDGLFVDLNYSNFKVFARDTYPETQDCRKILTAGSYNLKKVVATESDDVWEINDSAESFEGYGKSLWGNVYGLHQSMLLVSRQIHREAEALTYATAVFRVCLGQPLEFKRLRCVSDNALSNLGSLTIRLDNPKTEVWNDGWTNSNTPPKYIDLSTKKGMMILQDWTSIVERLARSVKPRKLRLRVVFRAKMISDARAVVEPMKGLPLLLDCGICAELYGQTCWWERKSHYYNHVYNDETPQPTNEGTEISQLVQSTIRKLTHPADRDLAPFRYLNLPQEIRFAILEYTELVSPDIVQWRPRKSIGRSSFRSHCIYCDTHGYSLKIDESDNICSCQCYTGLDLGLDIDDAQQQQPCCEDCRPKDYSGLCYCSIKGSIWSSSCKCCVSRHTLFWVSKQVRYDAISVYYARNQILVTPYNCTVIRLMRPFDDPWSVTGNFPMPRSELSLYLSSIACNALQHIRWLEWILPRSDCTYLLPRTRAWSDYLDTILLMQNAMNLSILTFTINISASGWAHSLSQYQRSMHPDDGAWRWYETIILPMRRLGEAGLKDFFVHLRRYDIEEGSRAHHERDLERAVMGKNYDSSRRGKPAERILEQFKELQKSEYSIH